MAELQLQLQPQLQKLGTRKVSFSIMDEARKKNLKDFLEINPSCFSSLPLRLIFISQLE